MKNNFVATHLNIEGFANASGHLGGDQRLGYFERLMQETQGLGAQMPVAYSARGEVRHAEAPGEEIWLHLSAQAVMPLTCQRCLGPVDMAVTFERSFRFVDNEALAATLDEESEEDVLVSSRDFNVLDLVEDELLMAQPTVPMHEACPVQPKMHVADANFPAEPIEKPNPFAALEQLKKKPLP